MISGKVRKIIIGCMLHNISHRLYTLILTPPPSRPKRCWPSPKFLGKYWPPQNFWGKSDPIIPWNFQKNADPQNIFRKIRLSTPHFQENQTLDTPEKFLTRKFWLQTAWTRPPEKFLTRKILASDSTSSTPPKNLGIEILTPPPRLGERERCWY